MKGCVSLWPTTVKDIPKNSNDKSSIYTWQVNLFAQGLQGITETNATA